MTVLLLKEIEPDEFVCALAGATERSVKVHNSVEDAARRRCSEREKEKDTPGGGLFSGSLEVVIRTDGHH